MHADRPLSSDSLVYSLFSTQKEIPPLVHKTIISQLNDHLCRYATASARSDGMFLLCGGRDASGTV